MPYTVIWYDKFGIVARTPFVTEEAAKKHASNVFPSRHKERGIVEVEVCNNAGAVIFRRKEGN